jgi:hypothetical protein
MTFLNAILLGGLFATVIPVIIHFFFRSRPRRVRWGAMHLLDQVLKSNARRIHLEQILLLLVRLCIPLLLGLCMARPVLTGFRTLLGNARSSMVLMLDNSYSMEAGGKSQSNFIAAKEAATRVLGQLAHGSEASLVLMAGDTAATSSNPTFDVSRIEREIARMDAGYGAASVSASLEKSAALLSQMHHATRDLVVISDFQGVNWSGSEAAANARSLELLQKLPLPPTIVLYHVGKEVTDNVCVESLDFSHQVLGVGQSLRVRANLHNFGDAPYEDMKVYFRVDGRERTVSQISLRPRETGQVLFNHAFDAPGSHVIEVAIDADPLKADNVGMASIPVWDRVPVLLVDGSPSPEPLMNETGFLEIALRPFGAVKSDLADLIATRTIAAPQLDAASLAEQRVVVLANVNQLADPQLKALEDFVRDGGGLLIFAGDRINPAWYNTAFRAQGRGLLPASLISLAGSVDEKKAPAAILAQHYDYPALEMFNDPRNGNLADGQVRLWYKFREESAEGKEAPAKSAVLARLDTGDPFLVEKKYGEGRVIFCCTPCDAEWSNLPMRPFYLPLMQQMVISLASTVYPPRNVDVGQSLAAFLPAAMAGRNAVMTDPDGARQDLPIVAKGTRALVEFKKAQHPGLYTMEAPDRSLIHFVVSTSRKESDLRQLSETELRSAARTMGASVAMSWRDYLNLDQQRRHGRELWRLLLWLTLGLCFGELALQQYFTKRSKS